jgi:hypothetical protein
MYTITKNALTLGAVAMSTVTYAATSNTEKHEFKSSSYEVNIDLERGRGEVLVHLQSAYFKEYEQIIIERSGDGTGAYTTCKTINLADVKLAGDYYKTTDRFPLSAQADSYYRIKTISKEGINKTYPPVAIAAIKKQ